MKIYRIKKGHHRSYYLWDKLRKYFCIRIPLIHFGVHYKKKVYKAHFKFDPNCLYDLQNNDNFDINKLCGFSYGHHHKHSMRIGWRISRRDSNKLELLTYSYNKHRDNLPFYNSLGDFKTDLPIKIMIKPSYDKDVIIVSARQKDKVIRRIEHFNFPKFKLGYYLYPYFGGNQTAPHTMYIYKV